MSRTPRRRFPVLAQCLLFAGLLLPWVSQARPAPPAVPTPVAEPWDAAPFTAAPAAIASAAKIESEDGEDVVVLLAEASYSYDEAGRETYVQRLVYRILTPGADESWSTVEEGWAPWHQARPEIRARVITPDGAEHALDPATVAENGQAPGAPDMFEDGRVLRGPLPATRPGAVVEQQVTVRDNAPFFEGGVVRFHGLDPGVPVRHARVILEAPAAAPLRWVARRLPGVTPKETVDGGRRRLVFEARDLQPEADPEAGLPPEVPRTSYVAFSTGRSWADLARRYSEIVDQTVRGADLAAFLRSAGGPAASQLDLINLYLARLADEVRYTGIELGEGGLMPRKPADTLRRKFGDCKDKAVLLTAMLRASDIPAYVALLNAGEDEADVEESLPGFGMFNHAIVVVPGNPAIWIDPTDPYSRAGELPVADQGRLALIASPTATGLTRTPEATAAENREIETREFFLADLGPSRVVETTEFFGAPERDLRSYYAVEDDQAVRQALKSYAASFYLAEDVAAVEHSKAADVSTPLRLRVEVKNARRGFSDTGNAGVGYNPASMLARLPEDITGDWGDEDEEEGEAAGEKPESRRDDYVFARPMTLEVRYHIVPPPGFAPQPLPASRVRRFATATLSEEYAAAAGGAVDATFRLDTGKRRITAQEFKAMHASVREALQDKTALLLFDQTGEAHLKAGRIKEALGELGRLAAADPKKALPRTRVARALLAGGMGEAAREEARRATQLDPKLAIAYRDLGWILQHDDLGRRFGPGFDRAGAIAAYRKAKELDPKDAVTRADLAILLEYDGHGQRYGAKADLGAAIDEYKALRKDLDNEGMDKNLLFALVRTGRFAEAKELSARVKDPVTNIVPALVAIAALDGAEAAVRESERKVTDPTARVTALQQTAQNLMLVRRYAEAAVLFDRAGRQSGNAAALLALADVLRRTRRNEEIALPPDQPASVAKRLMMYSVKLVTSSEPADPKGMTSLLSRDVQSALLALGDKAAAQALDIGAGQARKQLQSGEIPPDVATDLGLSSMRENVTGDEAVGYRVGFTSALENSAKSLVIYVVRDGPEYRVAGMSTVVTMLGDEALRRLERGDLKGARQWLDWALEHLDGGNLGNGGNGGNGGDPIPEEPFLALWTKKEKEEAGAEDIRCASAALINLTVSAKALPILLACRETAGSDARRIALDMTLAQNYLLQERFDDLLAVSRRLSAAAPASDNADDLQVLALLQLKRWDDLRALAERRLQHSPGDLMALRLLAEEASRAHDFDGAEKRYDEIISAGKATAGDFNSLAWMLLERGRLDEKTVDYGQRAATLSSYGDAACLHTLASIYADMGKTSEAYQVILQALAARIDESPSSDDWYVFGRLAEHYGLPEVARKYYKRVGPPPTPEREALSTHALAARRLAALGEEKKATTARR
jgi:tetratricopeptide (TPR) repeat protein/transglutaminase-like putative cysteine protease